MSWKDIGVDGPPMPGIPVYIYIKTEETQDKMFIAKRSGNEWEILDKDLNETDNEPIKLKPHHYYCEID